MISVFECLTWGRVDLLGVTPETVLALDPIVFPTPRKVFSSFDFVEEVSSVEVTVRIPQ